MLLFCRCDSSSVESHDDEFHVRRRCHSEGSFHVGKTSELKMAPEIFYSAPTTPFYSEDESVFNSPQNGTKIEDLDGCGKSDEQTPSFSSERRGLSFDIKGQGVDVENGGDKRKNSSGSDNSLSLSKRPKIDPSFIRPASHEGKDIDLCTKPIDSSQKSARWNAKEKEFTRSHSSSSSTSLAPGCGLASSESKAMRGSHLN